MSKISIVIPAYNEEGGIKSVVDDVRSAVNGKFDYEIIVVDDASHDKTAEIAGSLGVRVVKNPINSGQGASVKNGIRAATGDRIVLIDADGTYPADKIPELVKKMDEGFDLVVGARGGKNYWRSGILTFARLAFKFIAEIATFKKIPDINSGLRAFAKDKVLPILKHCSNRFSFMTSTTLIFLLKGHKVAYVPIDYYARKGQSKVRYVKDALKTLKLICQLFFIYRLARLYKKEFFWVLAAAIFVGALFILPPLGIWKHFSENNQPFDSAQGKPFDTTQDKPFVLGTLGAYRDELYSYLPRAREIYDGHFPPAELSLDKQGSTPFNALPSLFLAGLIAFFGGNINLAYLAAQFIFSAVIFILLYFLGKTLFQSKSWAFFIAFAGALTPFLINVFNFDFKDDLKILFDYTVKQFLPFVRTQMDKLRLARIDEPLLTYPIYLSAILAFLHFWKNPRLRSALLAAIPAGLLAYTYVHHWIYWTIFIGLGFIYSAVNLQKQFTRFRSYFVLLAILFLILIPYFINYSSFQSSPNAMDASYRFTVFHGRELGIGKENIVDHIVYAILAVLIWLFYFKKPRAESRHWGWVFLMMIAAILIARNIQLILGSAPTPSKWDNAFSPVFYLIFLSLIYELIKRWETIAPKIKTIVPIVLAILSGLVVAKYAFNAVSVFARPQNDILRYYELPSGVVESWDWINKNLPAEPKIISPSYDTNLYLMTYTSARPFVPRGLLSLASNFEIEERYLTAYKLFGAVPVIEKDFLNFYGGGFKKRSLGDYLNYRDPSIEPKIRELNGRYENNKAKWLDIDADYVYNGSWEKSLGVKDLSAEKNLHLIYENTEVKIFQIIKPN